MKTTRTLSLAATFAALIAAPMAFAQEDTAPAPMDGQMMQSGEMMGGGMMGDMSGMQNMMGMMQMMQQMGPMMEACTEMMQAMSDHPHQGMPEQKG